MKWIESFASQKNGIREYVPLLVAVVFFFVFTQYDTGMVEQVIKPADALNYIHTYHTLTFQLLIPFLIILLTVTLRDVRFAVYAVALIYGGWLDVYYFVFLGQPMPYYLGWMWGPLEPSRAMVFLVGFASLFFAFGVDFAVRALRKKRMLSLPR